MENLKVLSVYLSKRKPGRRIIKFNDGSVFRMSEDAFILNPVSEGDILSEKDVLKFKKSLLFQETLDSAFYLLNYRMRSEAELLSRLLQKGYEKPQIENAILYLKEKGYVNDREFAQAFAREKVRNKHIGLIALKAEFSSHRIEPRILAEVYAEIYTEFKPQELIAYHLHKLKKSGSGDLGYKEKNRLINALKRKGFEWDLIQTALELD